MIAAITLKFLDPFGTGKLVLFQVTYDRVLFYRLLRTHHSCFCRIGMHMNSSFSSSWVFLGYVLLDLI